VTVAVNVPIVQSAQALAKTVEATGDTKSERMQLLGAATAALQAKELADQAAKFGEALAKGTDLSKAANISVSVSLGSSKSQSNQSHSSDSARGSSVTAGGDVNITASGAGASSDITLQGSEVKAGGTARLSAEDEVRLLAAANTQRESNSQSSRSGSIGVNIAPTGISATASASRGQGQGAGDGTSFTNAEVSGQSVQIEAGGDTTLKGAVVQGEQVAVNVGGNLNIESLQDSSRYNESSKTAGFSVSVPITGGNAGASVNAGKTNIDSNYQSVNEQTAIRAGDGGFQVNVGGNTTLAGGQITSSDKAVQDGKNTFSTAGQTASEALNSGALTLTDLNNSASFEASGVSVGVNLGKQPGKDSGGASLSGAGFGQTDGSANSTTVAAISGIAGNTAARTGDGETGIKPIFNKDEAKQEVNAQIGITAEFGKRASKAWGEFSNNKLRDAVDKGDEEAASCWGPDGACRAGGHAVVGGLTGGVEGAIGAGSSSLVAPHIQAFLVEQGMPAPAAAALTQLSALGAGAALGGSAGGAAAFNEASNNAVVAIPVLVAELLAAGSVAAARTCLTSPACLNALRLAGTATVAKVASMLSPDELAQIPGFAQANPLPPVGPTVTPADLQSVFGSPPLNNPQELSRWLSNVLDGYPADEAEKWARSFVTTLPADQQRALSDFIMMSVQENQAAGNRRERQVTADLQTQYPNSSVQNQQYLRDKEGNIVIDPNTGTARRLDHVVIVDGKVVDVVETTSMSADKRAQIRHEAETRNAGGTFIRDRQTGQLVEIPTISRIERRQ
jgi:filamentous hemagglutinin